MIQTRRPGRVNVAAVIVLLVIMGVLGAGLVGGYYVRKRVVAREALREGKVALDQSDWRKACQHLRLYLAKYPNDVEWLAKYAEANLKIRPGTPKRLRFAIAAYRQILRQRPGDELASKALIKLYARVGDFDEMAYVCQQRLEVNQNDTGAALALGTAWIAQRKYDQAQQLLQNLVDRDPQLTKAWILLHTVALRNPGNDQEALAKQWLDQAVTANPASADLLVYRAHLQQSRLHEAEAALVDLENATKLNPVDPGLRLIMFEIWMERDDLERAAQELRFIESLDKETLEKNEVEEEGLQLAVMKAWAFLAARKQDWKTGAELARAGLKKFTHLRRLEFLPTAVDLLLRAGEIDEARAAVAEYHQRLGALEPGLRPSNDFLAVLDAQLAAAENKPYAVINLLETVVTRRPEDPLARKLLARAYEAVGQGRRALLEWEQCAQRWPNDDAVNTLLVNAYINQRRWSDALGLARKVQAGLPHDLDKPLLELKLAEIKARAQAVVHKIEAPEAMDAILAELDILQQSDTNAVDIRTIRAFIMMYRGKADEAVAELEAAVREAPDSLLAKLQLVDLCTRLGRQDRAIELCRAAVAAHEDQAAPLTVLTNLLRSANRVDQARQALEEGIPKLAGEERNRATLSLARLLLLTDAREEGIELLRRLAEEAPHDVEVRLRLLRLPEIQAKAEETSQLISQLKRIEGERGLQWRIEEARAALWNDTYASRQAEIIEKLNWCIERDPGWAEPVIVLGDLYERIGEDERAEDKYKQFFNLHPEAIGVADRLLRLLQQERRYTDAWAVLRRLPENLMRASQHRIRLALAREEYEDAIDALQARIESDPRDARARALLAQVLYIAHHETEQALRLLDEADNIQPYLLESISTRISILHTESRDDEIGPILEEVVEQRQDWPAYLMRAEHREIMRQYDLAEQDYRHLTTFADRAAQGFELLGNFFQKTDRTPQAIEAWKEGLKLDPTNLELQRRMVRVLLASRSPEEQQRGREMLDALLKREPNETDLLYYRSLLLLEDRSKPSNIPEAHRQLERVVELDPSHIRAWTRLIELARRRGDPAKLRDVIVRALGNNPRNTDLLVAQAQAEAEAGNQLLSRSSARRALEIDPNNIPARTFLVNSHLAAGEVEAAETLAKESLQIGPDNEEAQLAYAGLLMAQGRRPEALKHLEAFTSRKAGEASIKALLVIADLYRLDRNFEASSQMLDRADTINPGDGAVFLGRMRWYASQERYDDILNALTERQKNYQEESNILFNVASMLAYAGKPRYLSESMRLFYRFIALNPDSVDGMLGLAQVAQETGEFEVAENAYREALSLVPFHREALNNLAWILAAELGKAEEALDFANKGVRRYPEFAEMLDTRGYVLLKLGRLQDAQRDLESCLKLAERNPAAQASASANLGSVYLQMDQPERAFLHLKHALQVDDEHHVLSAKRRREVESLLPGTSQ